MLWYGLALGFLLLDVSGALLGTAPTGSLSYAAAFSALVGALVETLREREAARQGVLRIRTLTVLAPLLVSTLGLLGERVLMRFGILSVAAPTLPAAMILLTAAAALSVVSAAGHAFPIAQPGPQTGLAAPRVARQAVLVLDATLIACSIALGLWFVRTGIVPMLYTGNIDEVRFALTGNPEFSIYSRVIYLGSCALAIRLALFAGGTRSTLQLRTLRTIAVCAPPFFGLLLYGSKYLYVYPVIVALLSRNRFRKHLRIFRPRVIAAVLLVLYVMVFVTNIRGLGRLVGNNLVTDVFVVLPEYRDMAQTVAIADRLGMHVNTYDQLVWAGVPSELAGLFGQVHKTAASEAYVYKSILGYTFSGGSTRIGILGELYLNSRLWGVAFGVAVLAGLLAWLDNVVAGWAWDGFGPVLALALSVQLLWLFQSELETTLPITYLFLYYLALLAVVHRLWSTTIDQSPVRAA